ncbi:MAG: hypothetical protein WBP94_03590 [Rhodomicrobiaceae bacterium]
MSVMAGELLPEATEALLKVAEAQIAKADERKRAERPLKQRRKL